MWKPAILEQLKSATAALHVEAERHVRILEPAATREDYRRYLERMFGFHLPIEECLAADPELAALGFDAPGRLKRDQLEADLRECGSELSTLSRCEALPSLDSLARRLGCAYVLEGSTLGGPYILRKLRERPTPICGGATAFLECYGRETGNRWKDFAGVLGRASERGLDEVEVLEGAKDTFRSLITWLRAA